MQTEVKRLCKRRQASVEGKLCIWNTNIILMCEKEKERNFYKTILNVSLEYNIILAKINSKNYEHKTIQNIIVLLIIILIEILSNIK